MSLTVTADLSIFRRQLRDLGAQAPVAASRALNRSIGSVQTAAVRELARDMKLPAKRVRQGMALTRSTPRTLVAQLVVTSRRIVLSAFRARQTKRGVTYDVGQGRKLLPGAFLASMRSGHVGVFKRVVPSRSRRGLPRSSPALPIQERFGPSLPFVFTRDRIRQARERLAEDLMRKNLIHEVEFAARGVRGLHVRS